MRWIGLLAAIVGFAAPSATASGPKTIDPTRFLGLWIIEGDLDPAGQGTLVLEYQGPLGPSGFFVGGVYVDGRGRRCESGGFAGVSEDGEPEIHVELWCDDWSGSVYVMLVDPHHAKGVYEFWPGAWDTQSERVRPAPREGSVALVRQSK